MPLFPKSSNSKKKSASKDEAKGNPKDEAKGKPKDETKDETKDKPNPKRNYARRNGEYHAETSVKKDKK